MRGGFFATKGFLLLSSILRDCLLLLVFIQRSVVAWVHSVVPLFVMTRTLSLSTYYFSHCLDGLPSHWHYSSFNYCAGDVISLTKYPPVIFYLILRIHDYVLDLFIQTVPFNMYRDRIVVMPVHSLHLPGRSFSS